MLSFIMPVYRKNHILERCLKSLCEQSLKDWELIAVLDGPDLDAERIIKTALKKRDNYKVVQIEHSGAQRARNEGFKHASGEYVVFIDADVLIECHAAQAWVDMFERYPDIGFVYSGYKFMNEQGAYASEQFDPWLLRVRNYISTCFPLRKELFPGWNESLQSLQDWDFWLSVVEKGGVGKFMQGYAFSTEYPTMESISGKGCTPEVWLERVDAVKKLHNLPERNVCVSAIQYRQDGVRLAKLIGADYQDFPGDKPHKYDRIIQLGFDMTPQRAEYHARIFNNGKGFKNFLFWTGDNIEQIYNKISFNAVLKYATLLNGVCRQFVEDKAAFDMMKKAGFEVEIMPLPFRNDAELKPLPEKPRFLVDISSDYSRVFNALERSLPDVELDIVDGNKKVADYTGLIHFYTDRTMSSSIKRMLMSGRYVISNVQSPFAGFLDDNTTPDTFIPAMVEKVRSVASKSKNGLNRPAFEYYTKALAPEKLLEVIA